MATEDSKLNKKSHTIIIEISEKQYPKFIENKVYAKEVICSISNEFPELFPTGFSATKYKLKGFTRTSKKLGIKMRKIMFANNIYQIQPSFVFPYMRGQSKDIDKALFLLKFGVPFWALAFVFGRNAMYWYRIYLHLGNFSLVGTTIKKEDKLPEHILADEEHIYVKGEREYIATTVASGCILGAEVCKSAGQTGLTKAYGVYKEETQNIKHDYQPTSVNTDGWASTKKSWLILFPKIVIIQCFLHAYIKIRDRALKKMKNSFIDLSDKVWNCYNAETKRSFSQRIRRMKQWAITNVEESIMKDKLLDLCNKKNYG